MKADNIERERGRVFVAIGAFSTSTGWIPTRPIMLVHKWVTRSSVFAVEAIEEATAEGVRLTQREADRIDASGGAERRPGPDALSARQTLDEAGRQMDSFTTMGADRPGRRRPGSEDLVERHPIEGEHAGRDEGHKRVPPGSRRPAISPGRPAVCLRPQRRSSRGGAGCTTDSFFPNIGYEAR